MRAWILLESEFVVVAVVAAGGGSAAVVHFLDHSKSDCFGIDDTFEVYLFLRIDQSQHGEHIQRY